MKTCVLIFIAFFLACFPTAVAQTIVSGNVTGFWTPDHNPYIVSGNVNVVDSLIIQPGVIVQFDAGGLSIQTAAGAKLLARGNADSLITFEARAAQNPGAWNAIILANSGSDDTLDYCKIRSAYYGIIVVSGWGGGGNVSGTIRNCDISNSSADGILVQSGGNWEASGDKALAHIISCHIHHNFGNGIFVPSYGGAIDTATIEGCTIDDNQLDGVQAIEHWYWVWNNSIAHVDIANSSIAFNSRNGITATHGDDAGTVDISARNSVLAYNNNFGASNGSRGNISYSEIIYNCFWKNASGDFQAIAAGGFGKNGNYWNGNKDSCDVNFNIYNDPLFVDTAGRDFHLQQCSKCIDAGTPIIAGQYVLDADGTMPEIGGYAFDHQNPLLPKIAIVPHFLNFGDVRVDSNATQNFRVDNTGKVPLVVGGVSTSDSIFTVSPVNAIIDTADSQVFHVTFTPIKAGILNAWLLISHNARCKPDTFYLTGTGLAPGFVLHRRQIDFDTVSAGVKKIDSVIIINSGNIELTIAHVSSNRPEFTVVPESTHLAPLDSEMFYVSYEPSINGENSGLIVFAHNAPGAPDTLTVVGFCVGGMGVRDNPQGIPSEYALGSSYPNPFNPSTIIQYQLPSDSRVSLKIYNLLGQVVSTLVNQTEQAGYKQVNWNASSFASGIYFYRLEATSVANPSRSFTNVKKMVLVK